MKDKTYKIFEEDVLGGFTRFDWVQNEDGKLVRKTTGTKDIPFVRALFESMNYENVENFE